MYQSQAPHQLGGEVAFLRAECGATREGDAFGAVDGVAVSVRGDEGGVARGLDVLGDLAHDEIPGHALPARRARGAILRRFDTAGRDRQLHRGRALWAQAAFVDRAVGIAFDLEQLHAAIAVLAGVRDQRTPYRTVGADGVRLLGARDPQVLIALGRLRESD